MRTASEIPLPIRDMPENLIPVMADSPPFILYAVNGPPSTDNAANQVLPLWLQMVETWEHRLSRFGALKRGDEDILRSDFRRQLLNTAMFGKPISKMQTLDEWGGLDSITTLKGPIKRANMIGLWEQIKSNAWAFGDPAKSDGEVFLIRVNKEDLGGFDLMTCFADSYGAAKRLIQQSEPGLKKAFADNKIPWQPFEFPV